ncbi:PEP/pyruvate-binding domain-containing protein [Solwaraspora sp. WMMD791]|uniref:PEP/pyruvate-binding domain-containing protein n=1 Tax=Solwaraspora sp. WMMD791 TaxID=3016086 RepID=UPI00249C4518|nr:PEP/pyruvate-binding domain-containing protein [Solwaraspora sp. WMMD791]WFE29235.1 PEP/pyruvate-binding domain-containing protein [Solwaraspora sp. WMMD791]
MTRYVVALEEIGPADAGRVGRKAATLGGLLADGFAVPAGFAVTADAAPTATGTGDSLPDGFVDELAGALRHLGDQPVAVRSSGLAEDGPDLSYAGQYTSVLGVRGLDAVLSAIRDCWASARSGRVRAYQDGRADTPRDAGQPADRIGVLVQTMVDATAAGVAFSRDPVADDDGTALVSAVRGLGDRLAAGQVDAEEWRVVGPAASLAARPGPGIGATDGGAGSTGTDATDGGIGETDGGAVVLRPEQAHAVAELARRAARRLGTAQDIEWAFADDTLWLLQSRPVSTGSAASVPLVPVPVEVPSGFSTRNRSMDRPWTPVERDAFLPVFRSGVGDLFRYTTGSTPQVHLIGGWTYLTGPAEDAVATARRWERVAADVAAGRPVALIRAWAQHWRDEFAARTATLRDVDPATLDDDALTAHLDAVHTLFTQLHERYFQLTGAAIAVAAELGAVCADLLGWSPLQTARLRAGLTGDHMAATTALAALARLADDSREVRRWLAGDSREVRRWLADAGATLAGAAADPGPPDARFAAALADYRHRYTHRTLGFDLTEPTIAEQPAVLLAMLRAQLERPYDLAARRAAGDRTVVDALAQARAGLAGRPAADRQRFEAAYAASVLSGPVRDEKAYHATSVWALLRYTVREFGRRLVRRGVLDRVDDVFFLSLREIRSAHGGGTADGAVDWSAVVRRRRGEHAWSLANPGPPAYGTPPAGTDDDEPPPLSPAAQRAARVAGYAMGLLVGHRPSAAQADRLSGLAASTGRYRGPVRVVRTLADFDKVRPGDVLVCPETTAQWSMLFCVIGALVTDRGSVLSHPAILAREYRIPAVVATGVATGRLRDDDVVLVDGSAGTVLLDGGTAAPEPGRRTADSDDTAPDPVGAAVRPGAPS